MNLYIPLTKQLYNFGLKTKLLIITEQDGEQRYNIEQKFNKISWYITDIIFHYPIQWNNLVVKYCNNMYCLNSWIKDNDMILIVNMIIELYLRNSLIVI